MKKWIFIGVGIFLLVVFAVAAVVLPKVAQLKRAALKVAADNEAREIVSGLESEMSDDLPSDMQQSAADIPNVNPGAGLGPGPIPDDFGLLNAAAAPESEETTDPTPEGNGAVAWISDPDNPQNVLVEQKIRDELIKPTGALTEGDMEKLWILTFVLTKISDEGLKDVATLKQLKVLRIIRADITDAGLKEVATLPELVVLELDATLVTDAGLKEVARLEQLETLSLSSTQVSDEGLKELVKLKNLLELNLKGTKVTEAGVAQLQKALPNCTIDH
jgi:hypothetical protein